MRKVTIAAITGILALGLIAAPALAGYTIIDDEYNPKTGVGKAKVKYDTGQFAVIIYEDMDKTRSLTGKDRIKTIIWLPMGPIGGKPGVGGFPIRLG